MAAREVVAACERHKTGLALLVQRQQAALQCRVQSPLRVQGQGTIGRSRARYGDAGPGLIVEVAVSRHQQAVAVVGAAQKDQQKTGRAALQGSGQTLAQLAEQRQGSAEAEKLTSLHGCPP
ncbi:hypothetical protein SDC9_191075 [bioreactor metagenome]|uniref:Uncharacterized protein n=1 Tax=bioreactor metagenome TaxID=1076179 RepID=A0A645HWU9_9ZZZZ